MHQLLIIKDRTKESVPAATLENFFPRDLNTRCSMAVEGRKQLNDHFLVRKH